MAKTEARQSPLPLLSQTHDDASSEASFADLFAVTLPEIILRLMTQRTAAIFLQKEASLHFDTTEERTAFIASGEAKLDRLTAVESERLGIDAEQYALWRLYYGDLPDADAPTQPTLVFAPGPREPGVDECKPAGEGATSADRR